MSSIKTLLAGSVALFCLTSAAMAEECKVGLTMPSLNAPYFAAQVAAVEKAAKDQGCEITTADSQNDFSKQINDVEDMIAKGIDILILNPRDQEALVPAADAATKAGVKVVVMDSTLNPKANVVTQVRSSNDENGRLVGDWIAKKMKGTPIKMLLLSGNQGNPGGLDRRMGVIKGIVEGQLVNEGAVNLQILGQGWGDWATDGGLKAAEDLFRPIRTPTSSSAKTTPWSSARFRPRRLPVSMASCLQRRRTDSARRWRWSRKGPTAPPA